VAIGTGGGFPVLGILFGNVAQSFIDGQIAFKPHNGSFSSTTDGDFITDVNTYCLYYLLLSAAQFCTAALQVQSETRRPDRAKNYGI
jgi:hypothetical protein